MFSAVKLNVKKVGGKGFLAKIHNITLNLNISASRQDTKNLVGKF